MNAALTGMVPTRAQVPHVPVTPEQIAHDAVACVDAGATILHLHACRADESPAWERAAYEAIIPAIREQRPDAVICVSTSGRDVAAFERRADVLELSGDARPDMASLTLGSLNFRTTASVNAPDTIVRLATAMADAASGRSSRSSTPAWPTWPPSCWTAACWSRRCTRTSSSGP